MMTVWLIRWYRQIKWWLFTPLPWPKHKPGRHATHQLRLNGSMARLRRSM